MAMPTDRQPALLRIDLRREGRSAPPMPEPDRTLALIDMIANPTLGAA